MGLWKNTTRQAVRLAEMALRTGASYNGPDDLVPPNWACPGCGNVLMDLLIWRTRTYLDGSEGFVVCEFCNTRYTP